MRAFILLTPFMLWLMLLSSCSSPPKPPSVDETQRRSVNTSMAVDLQVCRNDLQNTRLVATEARRAADHSAATLTQVAGRQQAVAALLQENASHAQANSIYTVRFEFGSARVEIPDRTAQVLLPQARLAPLILLRGRTDGSRDSAAESRMARERAAAVRDYLVAAGVAPARIRSTYQPTGDHVTDNDSANGRALNRRVEIELYRALPVSLDQGATAN